MFISSNTHPPAKRCHALMKLFGLPAPVAKELCSSWFFFMLADFCHQIMIRDEHTSRCSSHWRVYSELDWQTASGWGKKKEALCVRAFCWPHFKTNLMRLEMVHVYVLKVGWPEICGITRLGILPLCTSDKVSVKKNNPVCYNISTQRLANVTVNFRCCSFHPRLMSAFFHSHIFLGSQT